MIIHKYELPVKNKNNFLKYNSKSKYNSSSTTSSNNRYGTCYLLNYNSDEAKELAIEYYFDYCYPDKYRI